MTHPPPFFKRGPAPLARLSFYVALSISLSFIDARFKTLELLRQGVSLLTTPAQVLAHAPVRLLETTCAYFSGIAAFRDENARLKHIQLGNAQALLRAQQLENENERLRKLLEVKDREKMSGQVAQILYSARDAFSRRIVIDKGQQQNIDAGQPVIDEAGVVGQVTRIFPLVAEVTLITDKDQAVPVQIVRNGLRSVVFGQGNGQLELRFMPANADVQVGDLLVTSGLDGIFLPGLPVARVVHIERDTSFSFAHIYCLPTAGVENYNEVMVLDARSRVSLPEQLTSEPVPVKSKSAARSGQKKKH